MTTTDIVPSLLRNRRAPCFSPIFLQSGLDVRRLSTIYLSIYLSTIIQLVIFMYRNAQYTLTVVDMYKPEHERIVAARVPKSYLAGLDELVNRKAFQDRSGAIRRAIYNLLVATKAMSLEGLERPSTARSEADVDKEIAELPREGSGSNRS